jgi:hypothetical protein
MALSESAKIFRIGKIDGGLGLPRQNHQDM